MIKKQNFFFKKFSQFNNSPFFIPIVLLIIVISVAIGQSINTTQNDQGNFNYEQF